ncbi:unnamed protein product, partial [Mesorhabditis belari]|uniref:Uncharacterized protein n=1 Tax=Mesorhabditis belari TaxID=2138241 RepID=A0AAF3EDD7_9BILA
MWCISEGLRVIHLCGLTPCMLQSPIPPAPDEFFFPPIQEDQMSMNGGVNGGGCVSWQLLSVSLHRTPSVGFGIAISGGRDNPHFTSGEPTIVISDVVPNGPAWGLLQVNDRILSANGVSFENIDNNTAVEIIKHAEQINMIVKRRVAMPVMEFEQRTLKFTLTKSKKKDDFGIVLGCKFYIKEIRNPKLAEKDPGLREGDAIVRINGQSVEGASLEECNKWLERSRDKLCLVIQRDVRRGTSRWPSQNTVYERVGSVGATPRHSPSPMTQHQALSQRSSHEYINSPRWRPDGSLDDPQRRVSSPVTSMHSPAEYDYYLRSQGKDDPSARTITFRKVGGSVGIRVVGGNEVGIFVSAVAAESPAAIHGVCCGDKIIEVNGRNMRGVTREAAVQLLLALDDRVTLRVEHARAEFEHVRNNQLGDNFYIRAHFSKEKKGSPLELSVNEGDIFHVTDTLFGGTVGLWQAARVYSASNIKGEPIKGVIPNQITAEGMAREQRRQQAESAKKLGPGGTLLRRLDARRTKSLPKNVLCDPAEAAASVPAPAYERVALNTPSFPRPVVLLGSLSDVARAQLLSQYSLRFGAPPDGIVRLGAVDQLIAAGKHAVLDISVESIERLQLAQYAPIVVLIDVDGRSRIREIRKKMNATHISSRKLADQTAAIKKHHAHLLSATVDATQEDGWFEALRDLIGHLQQRRLWMPEFPPNIPLEDVLLFPAVNAKSNGADSDVESSKGDYGDYSQRSDIAPSPMSRSYLAWDTGNASPSLAGNSSSSSEIQASKFRVPYPPNHHYSMNGDYQQQQIPLMNGVCNSTNPGTRFATLPRRIHRNVPDPPSNDHHSINSINDDLPNPPPIRVNLPIPSPTPIPLTPNKDSDLGELSSQHPRNSNGSQTGLRMTASTHNPNGGYSVSQLLSDSSHPTTKLDSDLNNLRLRDSEKSMEIQREREEASQRLDDAAQQLREVTQRLQAPLQPPSADMYSRKPIHDNGGEPISSNFLLERSFSGRSGGKQQQQPSQATKPVIAPKPNFYGDTYFKERVNGSFTASQNNNNQEKRGTFVIESGSKNGIKNIDESPPERSSMSGNGHHTHQHEEEPIVVEEASQMVGAEGGVVCCPGSRVELRIPPGALPLGQKHEIYVRVCQEGSVLPPIDPSRGETLLSPLVICGPQGLQFNKPAELRLPHNGSVSTDQWQFSLKTGDGGRWTNVDIDKDSGMTSQDFLSVPIHSF